MTVTIGLKILEIDTIKSVTHLVKCCTRGVETIKAVPELVRSAFSETDPSLTSEHLIAPFIHFS